MKPQALNLTTTTLNVYSAAIEPYYRSLIDPFKEPYSNYEQRRTPGSFAWSASVCYTATKATLPSGPGDWALVKGFNLSYHELGFP